MNFKSLALTSVLALGSIFGSVSPVEAGTCWFEIGNTGRLTPSYCQTSFRVNANGHNVLDVIDHKGDKITLVFWVVNRGDRSGDVELVTPQGVTQGRWWYDQDGDRRIQTAYGEMAIRS